MEQNGRPVTRAELYEALDKQKTELRDDLAEMMRQIETNLLSAFHGYARGVASQTKLLSAGLFLGGVTPPPKNPSS